MSKTEEFIKNHTNNQANISIEISSNGGKMQSYSIPWLTIEDTRKAVKIAREEIIEKVCSFIDDNIAEYIDIKGYTGNTFIDIESDRFINDLKQAIKDE